ncbi:hypothetical protein SDC9_88213 [bioreactor metagenome]|uniref:Uncharacterized protein n=1 Tax=bioreactor metagenome TaxID=1076179 RepID=A0A644ZMG1_9ZZZZ
MVNAVLHRPFPKEGDELLRVVDLADAVIEIQFAGTVPVVRSPPLVRFTKLPRLLRTERIRPCSGISVLQFRIMPSANSVTQSRSCAMWPLSFLIQACRKKPDYQSGKTAAERTGDGRNARKHLRGMPPGRYGPDELLRVEAAFSDAWARRAQRYAAHSKITAEPDDTGNRDGHSGMQPCSSVLELRKTVGSSQTAGDFRQFPYRTKDPHSK